MDTAVVIVEDSETSRRRLEAAVGEVPGMRLVGSAAIAPAAIDLLTALRPGVAIVDLFLGETSGIDVLRAIAERNLPTKAIVVTSAPSRALGEVCLGLGARFFFDKALEFDQFRDALQALRLESAE